MRNSFGPEDIIRFVEGWGICLNECFGWYLVKYVFGIIWGVMSHKMFVPIHQGDTSHKLSGPFLGHSFTTFRYVPQKICGGKCARLVRQKKSSGLFVEGILQQMFWGKASKISFGRYFPNDCFRKQLREIFFFLPKQCVKECLRLIFPALFEVYFLFFAKTYPKDSCDMFLGDTPQKTCEQGGLSQTFLFTVHSFCCKISMIWECSGKCLLPSILRKISQQKIPTTFERYEV